MPYVYIASCCVQVKLSWDRTSHQRLAVTQMDFRKVKNIDELEDQFQEYIAPYTSEDEEEEGEGNTGHSFINLHPNYVLILFLRDLHFEQKTELHQNDF